jgi:hypothetical protein
MGRQLQFHMLPGDLQAFIDFAQDRDPLCIADRDYPTADIECIVNAASSSRILVLWNRSIAASIQRTLISTPAKKYWTLDRDLPIVELSPSRECLWNNRAALLAGRIFGSFNIQHQGHKKWFDALSRWLRQNLVRSSIPGISYVGPAAFEWYQEGGVLVPMMIAPANTNAWCSWVAAQDAHRRTFQR